LGDLTSSAFYCDAPLRLSVGAAAEKYQPLVLGFKFSINLAALIAGLPQKILRLHVD
jgi:hypothetical protein